MEIEVVCMKVTEMNKAKKLIILHLRFWVIFLREILQG